jgi:hypothetical protein
MKTNKLIIPLITGALFAAAANTRADVDITITGSTAFRAQVWSRIYSLFDSGSAGTTIQPAGTATNGSVGVATVNGTMTALCGAGVPVHIRYAFNGSAAGLQALDAGTFLTTKDPTFGTNVTTTAADIAFADNFPNSCTPPIAASHFTADQQVGIPVFAFVKNNGPGMSTVTNITKELSWVLFNSGATVPSSVFGGTDANPVYLVGRDNRSGTRITVMKDTSFTSTPLQFGTNSSGALVSASSLATPGTSPFGASSPTKIFAGQDGYDGGGDLMNCVASQVAGVLTNNVIGYAGLKDATSKPGFASLLNYQGVFPSVANATTGAYPLFGFEHAYMKSSASDANKIAVFNALVAALQDAGYQSTTEYNQFNVPQAAAVWTRGSADGGQYVTGPGATF